MKRIAILLLIVSLLGLCVFFILASTLPTGAAPQLNEADTRSGNWADVVKPAEAPGVENLAYALADPSADAATLAAARAVLRDPQQGAYHANIVKALCWRSDGAAFAEDIHQFFLSEPAYAEYPPDYTHHALIERLFALATAGLVSDEPLFSFIKSLTEPEAAKALSQRWHADAHLWPGITEEDYINSIQARAFRSVVFHSGKKELPALEARVKAAQAARIQGTHCTACSEYESALGEAQLFLDVGREGFLRLQCSPSEYMKRLGWYFDRNRGKVPPVWVRSVFDRFFGQGAVIVE